MEKVGTILLSALLSLLFVLLFKQLSQANSKIDFWVNFPKDANFYKCYRYWLWFCGGVLAVVLSAIGTWSFIQTEEVIELVAGNISAILATLLPPLWKQRRYDAFWFIPCFWIPVLMVLFAQETIYLVVALLIWGIAYLIARFSQSTKR